MTGNGNIFTAETEKRKKERTMSQQTSLPTTVPDHPNWQPLLTVLGDAAQCAPFMFMGAITSGGIQIYLYKHRDTRQYLNVDREGNCYTAVPWYQGEYTYRYQPIPTVQALKRAVEEPLQ
jgi:hypothetical protein